VNLNYSETIEFLYNSLPVFHRIGGAAYKASLNNTLRLDEYFDHPHKKFKTIHIAGTNGKGSVSHMLASVLQAAGYRTGLYTSPHLKDYRERIRVDGKEIAEDDVVNFIEQHMKILDEVRPSFFEMSVAMAFDYFARMEVDIAVIEVGMGGRLDSTNIIKPLLSVITNISLDHTQFLGKTISEIAGEKAGIIKPGVPVVIGETQLESTNVFLEKAGEGASQIYFADQKYSAFILEVNAHCQNFELTDLKGNKFILQADLLGSYQKKNIVTVYTALLELMKHFPKLNAETIHAGIREAALNTGLRGRWEILHYNPLVICDTAHNEAGLKIVTEQLEKMTFRELHFVFGTVKDKDPENVLSILPKNARYYFTRAEIPRALDEQSLEKAAGRFGLKGKAYPTVKLAIESAKKQASGDDLIFIGGSNFVVAEAL